MACSRSRSTTSAVDALTLVRDPLGIKPMYVMPRGKRHPVRFRAQGIGGGRRARNSASILGALVASTLFYFLPEERVRRSRRSSSSRRDHGPSGAPTAPPARDATGTPPRKPWPPQPVRPRISTTVLERVGRRRTWWPMCRSPPFSAAGWTRASSRPWPRAATPSIEAYTITFRPEDQRLEAMPDDAVYARKMAAHLGIRLHEIEISPDVVDMLPRVVDVLDEPIGDPAAINTVLMCQAAREAGVKVLLSGMGADELFGGYRKHLACVLGAKYQTLPQSLRTRVVAPSVDRLPVAAGGRGLRYSRWAKRFLSFAELPEEAAFRRSYTLYDPAELTASARPRAGTASVQGVVDAHRSLYTDSSADRPRQQDVPDRHPPVPAGTQPRLHRPLEHVGVDRGTGSLRRPVRLPGGIQLPRRPEDQGTDAEGSAARPSRRTGFRETCVDRPKASFGAPLRAWVTNDLGPLIDDVLLDGRTGIVGVSAPAAASPDGRPTSAAVGGTSRSSCGSCSRWSCGIAALWLRGRATVNGLR